MPSTHRRLFIFFALAIVAVGLFFLHQVRRAQSIIISPVATPLISGTTTPIPPDPEEYILGNPGAPLTITEFIDFACEECRSAHRQLTAFVMARPQEVRLIFKDAPRDSLLFRSNLASHRAAWCAGKQNKFWAYADQIIAHNNPRGAEELASIAQEIKLNTAVWQACFTGDASEKKVTENSALAEQLGIKTFPAVFANNKRLNLEADIKLEQLLLKLVQP